MMAKKSSTSGVTTFPTPATAEKSKVYSVTANGTTVFVEHWKDLHYAHFTFKGKCEVVVSIEPSIGHRNLKFVHKYSISPRRYGVKAAVELNTLTFTIAEPRKLIIQRERAREAHPLRRRAGREGAEAGTAGRRQRHGLRDG